MNNAITEIKKHSGGNQHRITDTEDRISEVEENGGNK